MKNDGYLIGEVSKITGISKDTLHFYEKAGVLVPDFIDPVNQYRYYSRWNLWQLDIITTCRKLSIPLEQVKKILSFHDNEKVTNLLLEYRSEALRLASYYQQVADDILWYQEEQQKIISLARDTEVQMKWLEAETVIAGNLKREESSYHANLQEAAKEELSHSDTIRRKYGYILDLNRLADNRFIKRREYLKLEGRNYTYVNAENLYTIPAGYYAVFTLRIRDDQADFSPLMSWLEKHGYSVDIVFAEELGLQLFDYIKDFYCEIKAHLSVSNN